MSIPEVFPRPTEFTHEAGQMTGEGPYRPDLLRDVLAAAVEESRRRGYKTVVVALDDLDGLLAELREAANLRGYARHAPLCSYRPTYPDTDETTCDCGFDAVLEAYNAALASEDRP